MGKWTIESGPHTFSPKATDEYIDIAYMVRYDPGDGGTFKFLSRQKNDSTGFTRALAMAERIAASEGTTVDELLAKLDTEYDKLEAGKPDHFLKIGRKFKQYGAEYWETKDLVRNMDWDIARQNEIREIQKTIRNEAEK